MSNFGKTKQLIPGQSGLQGWYSDEHKTYVDEDGNFYDKNGNPLKTILGYPRVAGVGDKRPEAHKVSCDAKWGTGTMPKKKDGKPETSHVLHGNGNKFDWRPDNVNPGGREENAYDRAKHDRDKLGDEIVEKFIESVKEDIDKIRRKITDSARKYPIDSDKHVEELSEAVAIEIIKP